MTQPPSSLQANLNLFTRDFFSLVPAELRERIAPLGVERRFRDGESVYAQGGTADGIFDLQEGRWRLVRTDGRGHYQVLQFLTPPSAIGIVPLFDGRPAVYGVQSEGVSCARYYPAELVRALLLESPEGREAVLDHFGARIHQLVELVDALSLHSVPERVASLLLGRRRPDSSLIEFEEDQEALGRHLGCTRSAFNRALRTLANLGIIRTMFPVIRILDLPALERFARDGHYLVQRDRVGV